MGNAADSPGRNHLEEHQLLGGGLLWHPTPERSSRVNHEGVLGRQWDERPLGRGKACGVKHALAHIFHMPVPPIIPTVIFGQYHVVKGRPQLLAGHPQQHLRLGETFLHIEVVTVQGDTAMAICRPREEGVREAAGELFQSIDPALGSPEDLEGNRGEALIMEKPLMRRRVIDVDESLMALLKLQGGAGQGELVVVQLTFRTTPSLFE